MRKAMRDFSMTYFLLGKSFGVVSKCTLADAENIDVFSGKYCLVDKGQKSRSEAFLQCKNLNARLPLPKNEAEMADSYPKKLCYTSILIYAVNRTANISLYTALCNNCL